MPSLTNGAAFQEYLTPRRPDDVDLVVLVRQLLVDAGVSQQQLTAFDTAHYVTDAAPKNPEAQRYILNRFWSLQLMTCATQSVEERYHLIPNGAIEDWVRLFKDKVLPFIVKNNLPIAI